ncbi:hypothetical protein D3C81_2326800 [compost metagenome]
MNDIIRSDTKRGGPALKYITSQLKAKNAVLQMEMGKLIRVQMRQQRSIVRFFIKAVTLVQ